MSRNLKIPYSVGSFEEIVSDNYYLVDKTSHIRTLENYKIPVFLRPRRFGKTLWCSTLECYYDINRKDKFTTLFSGLDIGKEPTELRSSLMVMRFNFSKVSVDMDISKLKASFSDICFTLLGSFLLYYKSYFNNRIIIDKSKDLSTVLDQIIVDVKLNNLPPLYIIIDEYDNFSNQLITAHRDDLYNDLTTGDSFLRTFFKVIKDGVESQAVGKVFITGVLPITMDDLTSGFNIAEIITLNNEFHNMLGFTQNEVDKYLEAVFEAGDIDTSTLDETRLLLKEYYNGYKFLENSDETIYNSTILTYYLKHFLLSGGKPPRDMIDPNVKTDVSWIERLSRNEDVTIELLQDLVNGDGLTYDAAKLSDKFNMKQFFNGNYFPISLFYLGMVTVKDNFSMNFPNQTLARIFTEYYNTLSNVEVSKGYIEYFRTFLEDRDIIKLFAGYYKTYIGQIPAQAFDKINENFFRTTFFELCTRYLSTDFSFAIEANYPSGRSDWEMLGRNDSLFRNHKWIIEFKYFKRSEKRLFNKILEPGEADINQVNGYAKDILSSFPKYKIRKYICYIYMNRKFKMFEVSS